MMLDDFEEGLRHNLATLAREAVPDDDTVAGDVLPSVQPLPVERNRRVSVRVLAAAIAVVVAAGVVALATRHDARTRPVQTPAPIWTEIAAAPLSARSEQTAVFTGRDVIVWGGRSDSEGALAGIPAGGLPANALADGAAYDVSTNTWRVLPAAPIGARYGVVAAWTGSEMLVVGGMRDGTGPHRGVEFLQDGAAYDPARRVWRRLPNAPGCPSYGAWTGQQLIVAGTCANTTRKFVIAAYDSARNRWTTLPSYADAGQLVSVGGRVFAWSGALTSRGAVLDMALRKWMALPALPDEQRMSSFVATYYGHLAVASLVERPGDSASAPPRQSAAVDVLDLTTQTWRHYESTAITPALFGSEIASAPNALVWTSGLSFSVFVGSPTGDHPEWLSSGPGPVPLASSGESLVPIGGGRFFVWGGRLAGTEQDPTNRPTARGAVLQVP